MIGKWKIQLIEINSFYLIFYFQKKKKLKLIYYNLDIKKKKKEAVNKNRDKNSLRN